MPVADHRDQEDGADRVVDEVEPLTGQPVGQPAADLLQVLRDGLLVSLMVQPDAQAEVLVAVALLVAAEAGVQAFAAVGMALAKEVVMSFVVQLVALPVLAAAVAALLALLPAPLAVVALLVAVVAVVAAAVAVASLSVWLTIPAAR